jgi:eukaryotic-like serine/threonine-protein kinase
VTSSAARPIEDSSSSSDTDPRAQERVGSVLDEKWTLERILGSGGMGAVYAARHRNGARGAVKVLHPELARRPDVRERFLREGYAANRVEHRGAVQVLDDQIIKEGPDEGTAYLVMEILEGESLEERMERGPPLTEPELLAILDDVLAVLQAAHEHGVVHRDLKPANLFLNKDASGHGVKVLDFGLARLEELSTGTSAGLALGTPSFMAPEQASGRQTEIDARSDIFAIGATAFMILANRGVHEANGVLELVARMGTLPAPKLREVAPHVSEQVAQIIDRALEFQREDRYPSAAAMRADVVAVLAARRSILTASPTGAVVAPIEAPVSQRTRVDAPVARREAAAETIVPSEAPAPASTRGGSRGWFVLALLVASGIALLFLVPHARERSGLDGALGQIMAAGSHASAAESAPPASREGSSAVVGPDAALAAAVVPEIADAAVDAAPEEDAAALDASADAADDDDDDDDPDASDIAPLPSAPRAANPTTATPHPATKRPSPAPAVKHKRVRKHRKTKHR